MNTVDIINEEDGPKNTAFKVGIRVDESDLNGYTIWDPALQYKDPIYQTDACVVDFIDFAVQDGLAITLYWDGPTPRFMCALEGRGTLLPHPGPGWRNPQAAGTSGKILLSTSGANPGYPLNATIWMSVSKFQNKH